MEIGSDAFTRHLSGSLKFAYLLCGDEPLLVLEASDLLRTTTSAVSFVERHVFDVNSARRSDDNWLALERFGLARGVSPEKAAHFAAF